MFVFLQYDYFYVDYDFSRPLTWATLSNWKIIVTKKGILKF